MIFSIELTVLLRANGLSLHDPFDRRNVGLCHLVHCGSFSAVQTQAL